MIEIIGTELYQWDTGRSVMVTNTEVTSVHFANKGDTKAPIMDVIDGQARIPDYLLQTGKQLCVYAVANGVTVEMKIFYVTKRERPENYIYEEDQRNYIYALIESVEAATEAANQAAELATQTAQSAGESANRANEATAKATVAAETAEKASDNANKAATKAAHTAKSLMVVGKAEGTAIHLDDAIDQYFVGLSVFGKTTQDGTPTLDNPVELVSAGKKGSIAISIEGSNLLDLGAVSFTRCSNNGGVLTSNISGSSYASLSCPYLSSMMLAYRGQKFTFSADKGITGRAMAVVIHGTMSTGETYQQVNSNPGERFVTIHVSKDFKSVHNVELRWNFSRTGSFTDVNSTISNVQFEFGEVPTAYEAYRTRQTMTIATPNGLPGIPVTSGGNYTDANGQQWICDEIDFTRGVYVQRVGEYAYTGEESWVKSTAQNQALTAAGMVRYDARVPQYPKAAAVAVLSSHCRFVGLNSYDETSGIGVWVSADSSYLEVRIVVDMDTVDELRTWLAEQYASSTPVTVLYILATPIETPLPEEELAAYASLHTYRGNTTVSNDASAHMELEYVMDAKKYIDSLVKAPPAVLSNVTLLASKWAGSNSLYSQVVTISGITEYSKVDLLPSVEQLAIFYNKNVAFVTENEDGVVTVYAIGDKPTNDYTMQVQITEVEV